MKNLKFQIAVAALICLIGLVLGLLLKPWNRLEKVIQSPFYREPFLTRTEKLESEIEIQNILKTFEEHAICGLVYNVRVSQTSGDARFVIDCDQQSWINIEAKIAGSTIAPFSPFGIKKFAIIKIDQAWGVYTEEKNGENTFNELVTGIPKVAMDVIRIWPELKKLEKEKQISLKNQKKWQDERKESVKESFNK